MGSRSHPGDDTARWRAFRKLEFMLTYVICFVREIVVARRPLPRARRFRCRVLLHGIFAVYFGTGL